MRRKYHVVESTPGYLPEDPATCFSSRRGAEGYAAELARELRDEGYHTSGSARRWSIWAERDEGDLGRVIEITDCEEDCDTANV